MLRNLLLLNLAAMTVAAGFILYNNPQHHFTYSDFFKAASYTNFAFLVLLAVEGPPLFIQVDQAAGVVKYQRLFRNLMPVALLYKGVRGEFTTRTINRKSAKVWALFYNGDEQFYVQFHNGWTEAKLAAIHSLIKHVANS